MANIITSLVDSALGWFTRGGAQSQPVKWATGSIFNASEQAQRRSGQSIAQPTPPQNDDNIRLTPYGSVIPRISGTQLITFRQPFWKGPLIAEPIQTGGTTKYNYFMDLAYIICVGPIDGIHRFWQDGELRAEFGSAQTKLPGRLYTGTNTQSPDPTIQASETDVPAFRGVAYIVMPRFYLGETVRLPTFKAEVVGGGSNPF